MNDPQWPGVFKCFYWLRWSTLYQCHDRRTNSITQTRGSHLFIVKFIKLIILNFFCCMSLKPAKFVMLNQKSDSVWQAHLERFATNIFMSEIIIRCKWTCLRLNIDNRVHFILKWELISHRLVTSGKEVFNNISNFFLFPNLENNSYELIKTQSIGWKSNNADSLWFVNLIAQAQIPPCTFA